MREGGRRTQSRRPPPLALRPYKEVELRLRRIFPTLALAGLLATPAFAQDNITGTPLEVGMMAPDFELPGATRHGVLRDPIKLSDYRDKTVVIAFFYRARTRG